MTVTSTVVSARGVEIAVDTGGTGEPVMVLHGFTGSAAAMSPLTSRLKGFTVVAPDLIGHGRSPLPEDLALYSVPSMADQMMAVAAALGHDSVHLVGYSMGGRVALTAACHTPTRLRSLTLIGATAGIADPDQRRRRADADRARADRIEADPVAFVDEWMASPLLAGQARLGAEHLRAARAQRLSCDPAGLARSLRMGGTGSMPALHDRLRHCLVPTHVVVGDHDAKFCAVAEELADELPDAKITRIGGAGHAAHLERAGTTAAAIADFLRLVDGTRR